jgi:hypothetical protein
MWGAAVVLAPLALPSLLALKASTGGDGVAMMLLAMAGLLASGVGLLLGYISTSILVFRWLKAGDITPTPARAHALT